MDPNAALARARQLIAGARELGASPEGVDVSDYDALGDLLALAEQIHALDEWLSMGGFLPGAWSAETATSGAGQGAQTDTEGGRMPVLATDRPLAVGDKVKLKAAQESSYRPQSLLDYLDRNALAEEDAVFTITSIFDDHQGTKVDFAELDTRGGYYLRRFELADSTLADWERELLGDVTDAHRADIAAIGARLLQEASDRGWCGAFDSAIEQLNQTLTVKLPGRARNYHVSIDGLGAFDVTATSQEEADLKAANAARAAIQALG